MSFLDRWKTNFEAFFHVAPSWIHTAQTVTAFAAVTILPIVAAFDPAAVTQSGPVVNEIQTDLATIATLAGDGTATPSLHTALDRVQTNLQSILDMGHIKSDTAKAQASTVVAQLKVLSTLIPAVK